MLIKNNSTKEDEFLLILFSEALLKDYQDRFCVMDLKENKVKQFKCFF